MASGTEYTVDSFLNSNTMLTLAKEIDKIFEEKLKNFETERGDGQNQNKQALREDLLKEWIASLQTTNLDLITTYSELEREACNRLKLLSTKLAQSKESFDPSLVQQDLRTVLEVVRRVREEQSWSADGLEFHTISYDDVYGPPPIENSLTEVDSVFNVEPKSSKTMLEELEKKNKEIQKLRQELESLIANEVENRERQEVLTDFNDVVERLNQVGLENENLRYQLANCKELLEEQDQKVKEYKEDKMALVAEISSKHDESIEHRNKITELETAMRFLKMKLENKEDTIGQLNKEMKKSELSSGNVDCRSCCSCPGSGSKFVCPYSENVNDDKVCTIFAANNSQHDKLGKKISMESLSIDPASTSSDDQVSPVQNLVKDLKQEIDAKDLLLKGKSDTISSLESEIRERDQLIRELQRRTEQGEENRRSSDDMVLNMQNAVAAHANSVKILMQEKVKMEEELKSLREKLQTLDESTAKLSDEKRQLENECKNQLTTIFNLREALVDAKRGATRSNDIEKSLWKSVWRNVHDV